MYLRGGTQYRVMSGFAPGLSVPISTPLPEMAPLDRAGQFWIDSTHTGRACLVCKEGQGVQRGCSRERRGGRQGR